MTTRDESALKPHCGSALSFEAKQEKDAQSVGQPVPTCSCVSYVVALLHVSSVREPPRGVPAPTSTPNRTRDEPTYTMTGPPPVLHVPANPGGAARAGADTASEVVLPANVAGFGALPPTDPHSVSQAPTLPPAAQPRVPDGDGVCVGVNDGDGVRDGVPAGVFVTLAVLAGVDVADAEPLGVPDGVAALVEVTLGELLAGAPRESVALGVGVDVGVPEGVAGGVGAFDGVTLGVNDGGAYETVMAAEPLALR